MTTEELNLEIRRREARRHALRQALDELARDRLQAELDGEDRLVAEIDKQSYRLIEKLRRLDRESGG